MVKRSNLRTGREGKGRFILYLALAGLILFMGHRFFEAVSGDENGTSFLLMEDEDSVSLIDNRGTIFDRNFKELAVSLDRVSVYASVRDVNAEEVAEKLAPIFDADQTVLKSMLESDAYRIWLAKNISQEEEEAVTALDLDGIFLHKTRARYYPNNKSVAHVLGYVGKSMGLAGVEFSYNSLLNKYMVEEKVSKKEQEHNRAKLKENKQHLVLTIDLKIQKILEDFIAEQWSTNDGGQYAAILMECSSGKIIGAANYPSYDPNNFQEYSEKEIDNILRHPVIIPHKIRKLLWDTSLLQTRYEEGIEKLPWSIHSTKRRLGSQLQLWERLGFNDPLVVDFINDVNSVTEEQFWPIKVENPYDSVAETATPLHIITAVNSLMNGGKKVIPHTIDRVVGRNGHVQQVLMGDEDSTIDSEVSEEVIYLLKKQMMEGPLSSGIFTSESLSYTEKSHLRNYLRNEMVFSFIPRKNPKLMLFVFAKPPSFFPPPAKTKSTFGLVEDVQQIILRIVTLQEVMSDLSDMMTLEEKKEMNFELPQQTHENLILNGIEQEVDYQKMPDLKGYSLRKSLRLLKDLKLEIRISGSGVVVEQKPLAGEQVRQGTLCRLVLKPH